MRRQVVRVLDFLVDLADLLLELMKPPRIMFNALAVPSDKLRRVGVSPVYDPTSRESYLARASLRRPKRRRRVLCQQLPRILMNPLERQLGLVAIQPIEILLERRNRRLFEAARLCFQPI